MAVWYSVIKAALPYVSDIVAATIPAFTRNKGQDASAELVPKQIVELQQAVTANAESVKGLAEKIAQTLTALDASEAEQERRNASQQAELAATQTRCESIATQLSTQICTQMSSEVAARINALKLEQDARLETLAAEFHLLKTPAARAEAFERQLAGMRRMLTALSAIAMLALIVGFITFLH